MLVEKPLASAAKSVSTALKGQGALLNQGLQDRRERRVFHVAECRAERRAGRKQAAGLSVPEIRHGSPSRHGAVDLQTNGEQHIGNGEAGSSLTLWRLRDSGTQLTEQGPEQFLLVGLGQVVGRPGRAESYPHRLGFSGADVRRLIFPLDGELDGVDVLATFLAFLEVRAGAERLIVNTHYVGAVARLRRDLVAQTVFLNGNNGGNRHTALLASGVTVVGIVGSESCHEVEAELLVSHIALPLLVCSYYNRQCLFLQALYRPLQPFGGVAQERLDGIDTVCYIVVRR